MGKIYKKVSVINWILKEVLNREVLGRDWWTINTISPVDWQDHKQNKDWEIQMKFRSISEGSSSSFSQKSSEIKSKFKLSIKIESLIILNPYKDCNKNNWLYKPVKSTTTSLNYRFSLTYELWVINSFQINSDSFKKTSFHLIEIFQQKQLIDHWYD